MNETFLIPAGGVVFVIVVVGLILSSEAHHHTTAHEQGIIPGQYACVDMTHERVMILRIDGPNVQARVHHGEARDSALFGADERFQQKYSTVRFKLFELRPCDGISK